MFVSSLLFWKLCNLVIIKEETEKKMFTSIVDLGLSTIADS